MKQIKLFEVNELKYEDTESYRVTEMFISNRKRLLDELLREE